MHGLLGKLYLLSSSLGWGAVHMLVQAAWTAAQAAVAWAALLSMPFFPILLLLLRAQSLPVRCTVAGKLQRTVASIVRALPKKEQILSSAPANTTSLLPPVYTCISHLPLLQTPRPSCFLYIHANSIFRSNRHHVPLASCIYMRILSCAPPPHVLTHRPLSLLPAPCATGRADGGVRL